MDLIGLSKTLSLSYHIMAHQIEDASASRCNIRISAITPIHEWNDIYDAPYLLLCLLQTDVPGDFNNQEILIYVMCVVHSIRQWSLG